MLYNVQGMLGIVRDEVHGLARAEYEVGGLFFRADGSIQIGSIQQHTVM